MSRDTAPRRDTGPQLTPESQGVRRLVSPFRCRLWTQHSRPDDQLTDDSCKALRESIAKNGQHQPALGRPVRDDPDCEIEVICGARRHCVARALRRDLVVEVRNMTDAEAYVAMYEENLLREGDSPYVRAQILLRALRTRTYSSHEEVSRAFALSRPAVSRLLMLAQLPSIIVAAFPSSDDIRERWGVELFRQWADQTKRDQMAARARTIANKPSRPAPREVYETLITAPGGRASTRRAYRNVPVRSTSNAILFHEQDHLEKVVYVIPKAILSPRRREALKSCIVRLLEDDSLSPPPVGCGSSCNHSH